MPIKLRLCTVEKKILKDNDRVLLICTDVHLNRSLCFNLSLEFCPYSVSDVAYYTYTTTKDGQIISRLCIPHPDYPDDIYLIP